MKNLLLLFALCTICSQMIVSTFASDFSGAQYKDHWIFQHYDQSLRWIFNLPSCIPDCQPEDRSLLTAVSPIEATVVKAIDAAQKSIDFAQYTFSRRPIFDALVRAFERGVRVRGVIDHGQFKKLAPYCTQDSCQYPGIYASGSYAVLLPQQRLATLGNDPLYKQGSNAEKLALLFYNSPSKSEVRTLGGGRLMHHKFVLIDDAILLSGSGNWSSTAVSINLENLGRFDRSRGSEDGMVIDQVACAFEAMWSPSQKRSRQTGACQSPMIQFSPVSATSTSIVDTIKGAIEQSQEIIEIAMHHLVHPAVLEALNEARLREVKVRLVSDDDMCIQGYSPEMRQLVDLGAEVRYVPTNCQMFQLAHNKFAIFDKEKVINGSGNWSKAGLERNYENFIVHSKDSSDVSSFDQFYQSMWDVAVERQACSCDRRQESCRQRYCLGRPRN